MALEQKDLELIERMIYKTSDDIAVSIARSFERLEERIDAAESRIYSRLADVEDKIECSRQDLADEIGLVRQDVREIAHAHDQPGDVDPVPEV
jgi:ribosomal protein S14